MRTGVWTLVAAAVVTTVVSGSRLIYGQGQRQGTAVDGGRERRGAVAKIEDTYFAIPISAADQAYAALDGRHMHAYVEEQAAISRRYRDQGHPQLWGRIIGSSSDAESARWLLDKFKQIGLTDSRIQTIDLAPQWTPGAWQVTATGGGKTLHLEGSAQPAYSTAGTKPEGLDLEAAYVGLGTEADFAGRDVLSARPSRPSRWGWRTAKQCATSL